MDGQEAQKLKELNTDLKTQLSALQSELLKKNRALEIESALEMVRVKATAMRNSAELAETSAVLFHQLNELQINAMSTGVGIFDDANNAMELWLTTYSDNKEVIKILDYVNIQVHPVFENILPAREQNKPYALTVLEGAEVKQYYQTMSTYLVVPKQLQFHPKEFFYSFFFSEGAINLIAHQSLTEEECNIMKRFARAFGLIYTRFLDLKKAEMLIKDTLKQTSLDRVRGQIASMRSKEDLQRITPLLWNELTSLGMLFLRCGVFIVHETEQNVEVHLSAPDGHPLAVLNLHFETNALISNAVAHWQNQTVYRENWNKDDFINWTKTLIDLGQIKDKDTYQDGANPPELLYLHFVPFSQGMLYVGTFLPLSEEEIDHVKSLAKAFSIAYARYEDFVQLENTKHSIEAALAKLQDTQTQLIQSEKMASLGELTAGIAHEIKNPLNFVNNFSEVNKELLAELKEELDKGNTKEVKTLIEDVINNEDKIIFHGKRADSIVKGMLQHSRSSNGIKEPTDINALCDEYLRLAYHGLRAKDKTFNATMKTDFDKSIGSIDIIPQEIGRVILNLLTNAFYACTERSRSEVSSYANLSKETLAKLEDTEDPKYEPTVSISTRKITTPSGAGGVEIRVTDNGNGIPDAVKEKIFQPFFTTKPTGQGTGLGLSMSYDIVTKGHGGVLKAESDEGKGTTFTIVLPDSEKT